MKFWIINPYCNILGENWRKHRSTYISEALVRRGHEVVLWTSNFEHRTKTLRSNEYREIKVNDKFRICLVPSLPYKKHISLKRVRYERIWAKNFREKAIDSDDSPDLLIMGDPSTFHADIILDVIRAKKLKFIIDVVDLWPELFIILFPKRLKLLGELLFSPLYYRRARFFSRANGLMAATKDYLQIAKKHNPDVKSEVVYLGVELKDLCTESINFSEISVTLPEKRNDDVWIIYAGTLGDNYDIRTIMKVAIKIEKSHNNMLLLIAGSGPLRGYIENIIRENSLKQTIFLGTLSPKDLNFIYSRCDVALSSYVEQSTVSMPIKAFDYIGAGLPMMNSLGRDLGEFLKDENIGLQYKAEDPDDLFNGLIFLKENPSVRKTMHDNCLRLSKIFDAELQYGKYTEFCESIVKGTQWPL